MAGMGIRIALNQHAHRLGSEEPGEPGESPGPDLLAGTGTFDSAAGYELGGLDIGATISGGKLRGDSSDVAWAGRVAAETITPGTYRVTGAISGRTFGNVRISVGSSSPTGDNPNGIGANQSTNGTISEDIAVTAVAGQYVFILLDSTNAQVDDLVIQRVN